MGDDTDHRLLDRARSGDRQALEQLLERHESQVYRFGMKMCRDPEDARDVLQDTLLAMARSVRDFRGASSISTWLYTIARGACIKKRRRSKFAPKHESSLDAADVQAQELSDGRARPDDILASKEVERALGAAIDALEPMYREVLVLRDAEGLTAKEVSEVLGVSVEAVKSRLHRARLEIRQRVLPFLGIEAVAPSAACPDIVNLFSRYLEGDVSKEACAEMERHLEACARCTGACESLRQTLSLCRGAGAALEVPASVQASVKVALRDVLAGEP
jgi:RNA polymerase sigma-70 factor (ECF subfamily)